MPFTVEDMSHLARGLYCAGAHEAEETQVALAWLARNLRSDRGLSAKEIERELCALAKEPLRAPVAAPFENRRYCRAFAVLCQVWAGDRLDPIRGATCAFPHDGEPPEAECARATALIGPWVFYRFD